MSTPRPAFPVDEAEPPDVDVDWAALPDDWRERSPRGRYMDETRGEYANRVRAMVAEGLVDPGLLRFADHLAGEG